MLDEFNDKMTTSKSGTTCKILQYLVEPSKVLQKCCSSFKFLWNWANTVNICAALKTESLFSLVYTQSGDRFWFQPLFGTMSAEPPGWFEIF